MESIQFYDEGFENAVREALSTEKKVITLQSISKITGIMVSDSDAKGIGIPWTGDRDAFNMNYPKLFFNVNNSVNGMWMLDIGMFKPLISLHLNKSRIAWRFCLR